MEVVSGEGLNFLFISNFVVIGAGLLWAVMTLIAVVGIMRGSGSVGEKALWLLVVFFFPSIGVLAYWIAGRKKGVVNV